MTEEQLEALLGRLDKIDGRLDGLGGCLDGMDGRLGKVENELAEGMSGLHTAAADTRRDIGRLDKKLVKIQEALYFMAHKMMAPEHSEELRSTLPDPPKRRVSFG